jgi:pimeloyl-ACP methyl ester carboxylesterase
MLKISSFAPVITAFMFLGLTGCQKKEHVEVKKQKVDGIDLAYYTRGNGEPLFLVTGFKGTMASWDPRFIEELAKNYTVIAFDNRGAGLSSDTKENQTTIQQMSADTAEFIRALGYRKVNLLGWSMGTSIAIQLSLDHPELLKTLILCAPNAGGPNHVLRQDVYEKLTSYDTPKEEILSIMFPDTLQGRTASDEYVKVITEGIKKGSVPNDLDVSKEAIERQSSALKLRSKDNHLFEKLPDIKVPTLVAGGLEDVIDLPENTRAIANRIPYAWAAYFPNSGHEFTSQDHLQFSRLIHLFIESENKE